MLDQLTRETLAKAITDLGVLERMKGVDATETVQARIHLEKALKEMSRRGLFTFATAKPAPEPQLPATAPQHNLPPTREGLLRPPESHSLLDQLTARTTQQAGGILNPELSRREFTQRAAATGARLAMGPLGGGGGPSPEPAHITAAKKLVSDFVGSGDYESHPDIRPAYAKQLIEAFKTHPDYKHEDITNPPDRKAGASFDLFTHKGGEHEVQLWHAPARETRNTLTGELTPRPEAASGSTNPYIHNAEDHPEYDQALAEKAHQVWTAHKQGEHIYMGGHDRSQALVSGTHLAQYEGDGTDTNGDPISHHKLYEHDWGHTDEITPVESPQHVEAVLHDQMRGGKVRKGENIRQWMDDELNYTM